MKTEVQRLNEFLREAPELIRENKPLIDYLTNQGFFKAPASTKYHGNYPGGLYDHSYRVTEHLKFLTEKLGFEWKRPESPFIIGMGHDVCKIDLYEMIVDDPGKVMFGSTEPEGMQFHYDYNKELLLSGHGAKSALILSTFLQLTEEEMLCIRYHMGAYEKDDWTGYDLAIRKYPTVLYTHTADMLASKVDGT